MLLLYYTSFLFSALLPRHVRTSVSRQTQTDNRRERGRRKTTAAPPNFEMPVSIQLYLRGKGVVEEKSDQQQPPPPLFSPLLPYFCSEAGGGGGKRIRYSWKEGIQLLPPLSSRSLSFSLFPKEVQEVFIGRPIFSNGLPLLLLSPTGDERGGGGRKGGPYLSSSNTSCVDLISKLFLLPFPLPLTKNPPTYPRVEWEKDGKQFFLRPPGKPLMPPSLPPQSHILLPLPSPAVFLQPFAFFASRLFVPFSPSFASPSPARGRKETTEERRRGGNVSRSRKKHIHGKGKGTGWWGEKEEEKRNGRYISRLLFLSSLVVARLPNVLPPPLFYWIFDWNGD